MKDYTSSISFKKMSIQINLDGLSFCIFNPALGCIESIYQLPLVFSDNAGTAQEIKSFITSEHELRQDFDTIKVIYNNEQFALIPQSLFSTQNMVNYLKFSLPKYENQIISHDTITEIQAVNAYIPNTFVGNILREVYGLFEYQHFITALLDILLLHNKQKGPTIYAHFEKQSFHLVMFNEGKVIFLNRFSFEAEIDMLYYLLFSLEQTEMDTEKVPIYLLGDIIRNSERFRLIYKYIRYIYFLPPQKNNPFSQSMDLLLARQNFILTHSF